jgi:hypothetical protein
LHLFDRRGAPSFEALLSKLDSQFVKR